jgi:acetolactate synthase-1/3 small subunit
MKQVLKHTVSCFVKNQPGVLARIASSFAEKGINITSLAVGELEDESMSRMTIVVRCQEELVSGIVQHLRDLVDVIEVEDLDTAELIERELVLIKVKAEGEDIARIMQLVEIMKGTVVGMEKHNLTIEMTGPESKVDAFVNLVRPFGIVEMVRTGRVAVEHHEDPEV